MSPAGLSRAEQCRHPTLHDYPRLRADGHRQNYLFSQNHLSVHVR